MTKKLTEHEKTCNKYKSAARKRLNGFIRVAKDAYNHYKYFACLNEGQEKMMKENMVIAEELIHYLKQTRDGNMLRKIS